MNKKPERIYKQIGLSIRYFREQRGWSQQELANKVKLTRTSICNIEAGRQRILLHDVLTFTKALKTCPKYFFAGIWI